MNHQSHLLQLGGERDGHWHGEEVSAAPCRSDLMITSLLIQHGHDVLWVKARQAGGHYMEKNTVNYVKLSQLTPWQAA